MKVRVANLLQKLAIYMIFAGVIASFFFIGWRVVTKGEYERHELAQCEALAVSAALASCGALDDEALASYVREHGKTSFIIDHKKMPGNNVVSVSLEPSSGGFFVLACAKTSWNSRSPHWAEATARKDKNGFMLTKESKIAKAFLNSADSDKLSAGRRLTFTFPHERECPVAFDVIATQAEGLHKTPLTVLRLAKEQ